MKYWWLSLLFFLPTCGFSQVEFVSRVTELIAQGNYPQARLCVDSALHDDPRNVNAWMMKGNVLLNYVLSKTEPHYVITTSDESIFSPELADMREPQRLLRPDAALQIEKMWRYCLQLDSTRTDIRSGLCTIYAMADWPDSLLNELPAVVRASAQNGEAFSYTLATYAHILKSHGDVAGCYRVYEKLCELYPTFPGIRGDEAAQYQLDGDIAKALAHIAKAAPNAHPDERLLVTAIDIYTAADKPLNVIEAFRAAEKLQLREAPFYLALYHFSLGEKTWKNEMFAYLKSSPTDTSAMKMAAKLTSPSFKNSYSDFQDLLKLEPNDFELQLLSFQATNKFPDSIQPRLLYAATFLNGRNYSRAAALLADIYNRTLPAATRENVQWQYAWALYASGDYARALTPWSGLKLSKDPAVKSSALYFTARCYQQIGMPDEAETLYRKLSETVDNKYGFLSQLRLKP